MKWSASTSDVEDIEVQTSPNDSTWTTVSALSTSGQTNHSIDNEYSFIMSDSLFRYVRWRLITGTAFPLTAIKVFELSVF